MTLKKNFIFIIKDIDMIPTTEHTQTQIMQAVNTNCASGKQRIVQPVNEIPKCNHRADE